MSLGSFGATAAGALGGAGTGSSIGSAFGPIGTGIGALLGGIGGGIGGYQSNKKGLLDNPSQTLKFDRFTPEQQNILAQLQGALTGQGGPSGGLLGDLLGPNANQMYEDRAKKDFQQNIIPKLAEGYAGSGVGFRSSAFRNALGEAGADLAARIQEGNQSRQMSLLVPLLNSIMQPQFNTHYIPGGPSGAANMLGGLAQTGGNSLQQNLANTDWTDLFSGLGRGKQDSSTINSMGNITGKVYRQ